MKRNQEQLKMKLQTKSEARAEKAFDDSYDQLQGNIEDFMEDYGLEGIGGVLDAVSESIEFYADMEEEDRESGPHVKRLRSVSDKLYSMARIFKKIR